MTKINYNHICKNTINFNLLIIYYTQNIHFISYLQLSLYILFLNLYHLKYFNHIYYI